MKYPLLLAAAPALLLAQLVSPATAQSNGLAFDGQDDHVLIPKWPTLPGQNLTVALWVEIPSVPTAEQTLVTFGPDQKQQRSPWSLRIGSQAPGADPSRIFVTYEDFAGRSPDFNVSAGQSLVPGTWHFVAFTLSSTIGLGGELMLMLDDPQQNLPMRYSFGHFEVPVPALKSNGALFIGADSDGGFVADSRFFQGMIDDVQVWNRALSVTELDQLRSRIPDSSSPGLVGFWKFEEAGGQTVIDCALPSNNGILGGSNLVAADDPMRGAFQAPVPANIQVMGFHYPEPDPGMGIAPPDISVIPGMGGFAAILSNAPANSLYALVAAPNSEYFGLECLFPISPGLVLVPTLGSALAIDVGFTSGTGDAASVVPAIVGNCSQLILQYAVFTTLPVATAADIWMTDAVLIQTP